MNAYYNDQLLEKYCAIWQRNWGILVDKWIKSREIDLEIAHEQQILEEKMEALIPQSHVTEIKCLIASI